MISSFPDVWLREPSFETNRRLAIASAVFAWSGLLLAYMFVTLPDLVRAFDSHKGFSAFALLLLSGSVSIRLYRSIVQVLERIGTRSIVVVGLLPAVHGLFGFVAGWALIWKIGIGLWTAPFLLVIETVLALIAPALRALLRIANRYAPGSPARLALDSGLTGRNVGFMIPLLRFGARLATSAAFGVYVIWASVVMFSARLVRVFGERRSYVCDAERCHLAFDDPELGCSCGDGQFRSFPRLRRPWIATCSGCARPVAAWRSTNTLIAEDGATLSFEYCVRCRNSTRRRIRVVIVPIDGPRAAVFAHAAQKAGIDVTMAPTDHVIWGGDADAILVAAREGQAREGDARFALNHVALPRSSRNWEDEPAAPPKGRLRRLFLWDPGDPMVMSYGRRRMPPVAMLGEPGTEIVPNWIYWNGGGLRELLEERS